MTNCRLEHISNWYTQFCTSTLSVFSRESVHASAHQRAIYSSRYSKNIIRQHLLMFKTSGCSENSAYWFAPSSALRAGKFVDYSNNLPPDGGFCETARTSGGQVECRPSGMDNSTKTWTSATLPPPRSPVSLLCWWWRSSWLLFS